MVEYCQWFSYSKTKNFSNTQFKMKTLLQDGDVTVCNDYGVDLSVCMSEKMRTLGLHQVTAT